MKRYGLTLRCVIKNSDGEILILKRHPLSKTDPCKWELPGGKVESGEDFNEGLIREVKEETNLDCEIDRFCEAVEIKTQTRDTIQIIMYVKNVKGDIKISEEHTEWMWCSLDDLDKLELSDTLINVLKKKNYRLDS